MTDTIIDLHAPEPLAAHHDLDAFSSSVAALDDWLKRHARHNEAQGGSRTYVLCAGVRVIGYYSLATSSILSAEAIGRVKRNMPSPIPAILLGRLAIDQAYQRQKLGSDLLRDAMLRCVATSKAVGIRAILVHAISTRAKIFYEQYGFRASTVEPMTLMITMADAERSLEGARQNAGGPGHSPETDNA